ncbi:MAG: sensor histidine kinase [Bryobacteraceae bacterium]|nr:sensor histidine kinase [Bryobacteraceae bacterium]
MARGAATASLSTDAEMHVASAEPSTGLRTIQASMPLFWRRHLGTLRVFVGLGAFLLYILEPAAWSSIVTPLLGVYAGVSAIVAVRHPAWSFELPFLQLIVDSLLFVVCAAHDSDAGFWLSAAVYAWLMTQAGLMYRWYMVVLVAGLNIAAFAVVSTPTTSLIWPVVVMVGCTSLVLAIQRRTMEDRLAVALRRSVLSRSEAELAREQERQRIAADFHDGPLQSFISFQMRLEIIRKLIGRDVEHATRELLQLQDLGRTQVTELRAFVRGMQPAEVTSSTLTGAVREAVEHFERDSGIGTELFCGNLATLDDGMALDVLQIIREILNNARKHSKASRMQLEIETDAEGLRIRAEDDGSGFPFSGTYSLEELEILRLGPKSIQRRVRTLGGEMRLQSKPTEGAVLTLQIPMGK